MAQDKDPKNLNVPPLRFPGFSDEWKLDKLENLVTIKSGVSPNCISNEGELPYYKVEQLNNCVVTLSETPYFAHTSSNNIIPFGSIIFPKRGAAIMTNKVRISKFDCVLDTNLMALITNRKVNNRFLYYFILRYKLGRIADTSTIPQINNVHINPIKMRFPGTHT